MAADVLVLKGKVQSGRETAGLTRRSIRIVMDSGDLGKKRTSENIFNAQAAHSVKKEDAEKALRRSEFEREICGVSSLEGLISLLEEKWRYDNAIFKNQNGVDAASEIRAAASWGGQAHLGFLKNYDEKLYVKVLELFEKEKIAVKKSTFFSRFLHAVKFGGANVELGSAAVAVWTGIAVVFSHGVWEGAAAFAGTYAAIKTLQTLIRMRYYAPNGSRRVIE